MFVSPSISMKEHPATSRAMSRCRAVITPVATHEGAGYLPLLPAGRKNVLAWAEAGEPPHFAKHGIQSRTAEQLAFQSRRPYRRLRSSSVTRAVIEVLGELASTWAVMVTTASRGGETMQNWP